MRWGGEKGHCLMLCTTPHRHRDQFTNNNRDEPELTAMNGACDVGPHDRFVSRMIADVHHGRLFTQRAETQSVHAPPRRDFSEPGDRTCHPRHPLPLAHRSGCTTFPHQTACAAPRSLPPPRMLVLHSVRARSMHHSRDVRSSSPRLPLLHHSRPRPYIATASNRNCSPLMPVSAAAMESP